MQAQWHMHRLAYRISGGSAAGDGTLALHTVGRRSGKPRMTLLNYLDDDGRYVVVASNAGSDRHPAWWLNPVYAGYAAETARSIPVVVLEPVIP